MTHHMRHLLWLGALLVVGGICGCSVDSIGDSAESADSDLGARKAEQDRAAPLGGDELRFQRYVHVNESTPFNPSHRVASSSDRVYAGNELIATDAYLYLEADRTFTLFYSETVMADAANGRSRTQRKLTGTWHVEGTTLYLGDEATGRTAMTTDAFNKNVEGLFLTLPAAWAGDGLPDEVPFLVVETNVWPTAPYFSDFH